MKICKDCNKKKKQSDYYGLQNECKECTKKRVKTNRRENIERYRQYDKTRQRHSEKRILDHRYNGMRQRTEGRAIHPTSSIGKEICSKEQFLKWHKKNREKFLSIYEEWAKSGFSRKLAPSIDRTDNQIGYVPKNMNWVTLSENSIKS